MHWFRFPINILSLVFSLNSVAILGSNIIFLELFSLKKEGKFYELALRIYQFRKILVAASCCVACFCKPFSINGLQFFLPRGNICESPKGKGLKGKRESCHCNVIVLCTSRVVCEKSELI